MADGDRPKRKRGAKKAQRKAPRRQQPRGAGGKFARAEPEHGPPAEPTGLQSIDLTDRGDRALMRRAISQGWQLHGEDLQRAHGMLRKAAGIAEKAGDDRGMRECVKLWLAIAAQVQSDEQLDARLAAGQGPEGNVTIRVVRED